MEIHGKILSVWSGRKYLIEHFPFDQPPGSTVPQQTLGLVQVKLPSWTVIDYFGLPAAGEGKRSDPGSVLRRHWHCLEACLVRGDPGRRSGPLAGLDGIFELKHAG